MSCYSCSTKIELRPNICGSEETISAWGSERRGPYATMGFNTTRVIHDWMQLATAMTSESEPSRGFGLRLCKKSSKIPNSVETFGGLAGGTWSVKRTHHGGRTKLSWYCIICQSNLVMETHTHTFLHMSFFKYGIFPHLACEMEGSHISKLKPMPSRKTKTVNLRHADSTMRPTLW